MNKEVRYHLISASGIFLFGGLMNILVFCTSCLEEPFFLSRMFWINFSYNGLSWMVYWKGSEFLVDLLNQWIPWIKAPIKRFLLSLTSIAVFVFLAVWGLDLFFDLLFFNKTVSQALQKSGAPFWNVFFITLAINVFMHGRSFLYEWRQASIDVEKLRTEQVFTQFQSLKNQVNPHFLFNSLNALSSLVYEDQEKAVEFIRKLAQVYRYVLDKKDDEVVPLKDEIDFLQNFIFLQKIRFGENIKFELIGDYSNGYVPPLSIQLLVENAIKHNVISDSHPLNVTITIKDEYIIVTNNIKEKLSKDSTGIGLNNLKERYQYLSDKLVELFNDGTFFEVRIPILTFNNEIHNH